MDNLVPGEVDFSLGPDVALRAHQHLGVVDDVAFLFAEAHAEVQIQGLSQQAEVFDAGSVWHGFGRVPGIWIVVAVHHQLGEQYQVGPGVLGLGRPPVDGAQIFFRLAQQPVHGHRRNFQCLHELPPHGLTPTATC